MVFKIDRIGIGTSSPDELLQVDGNIKVRASDTDDLYLKGSSLYRHFISSGNKGSGIHFTNLAMLPTNYAGQDQAATIDLGSTTYRFKKLFGAGLDIADDVGIGTTSARCKLDIYTGSTSAAGLIIDRHSADHYRTEFYQGSNGLAIKVGGASTPTEIMRITPSAVGIGTTTPLSTLQVGDGTGLTSGDAPGSITVAGTGATKSNGDKPGLYHRALVGLGLWSDHHMSFEVNGYDGNQAEAMRIITNGNVGIGTNNPSAGKLDILVPDGGTGIHIRGGNYGTDNGEAHIRIGGGGASSDSISHHAMITGGHTSTGSSYLSFSTLLDYGTHVNSPVERMRINHHGNVGIGTTSPLNKLDVRSDNYATFGKASPTVAGWSGIRLGTPYTTNHDAYCSVIESYNDQGSNYNSILRFKTSNGDNAAATERMRITSAGNVGIGTTTPLSTLQVGDDSGSSSGNAPGSITVAGTGETKSNGNKPGLYHRALVGLGLWSDGQMSFEVNGLNGGQTEAMRINASGNVGIGTTTPLSTLQVGDDSGSSSGDAPGSISVAGTGATKSNGNKPGLYHRALVGLGLWADGQMSFEVNGHNGGQIEAMRINASGNVGIGTTTPADMLEIYKSGASDNVGIRIGNGDRRWRVGIRGDTSDVFAIQDDTGGAMRMVIDSAGNVGIGTTPPNLKGKLDIYTGNTNVAGLVIDRHATGNYRTEFYQESDGLAIKVGYDTSTPSEIVRIQSNQVGIGTTSPRTRLHVGKLSIDNADYNTIPTANMGISANFPYSTNLWLGKRSSSSGQDYWGMALGTVYSGNSYIQTLNKHNSDHYNLLLQPNGGNVGIGTTSPDQKLDVRNGSGTGMVSFQATSGGFTAKRWSGTYGATTSNPEVRTDFGMYRPRLTMWNSAGTETVFISGDSADNTYFNAGNVGIGISNPDVPLHVTATTSTSVGDTHRWVTINAISGGGSYTNTFGGSISDTTGGNYTYSIKTVGAISSPRFIIGSDERIKKDIVDVEDDEALVKLRKLHPKKYRFIDESERGAHQIYGFLANEVKEVLPDAIVEHPEEVPSIYQFANATSSNVITFSGDFNTSQLESNVLVVVGVDQVKHTLTVDEIIDSTTVRVVEDLSAFSGSLDEHGNVVTETQTLSITPEEYDELEDKNGFEPISDDSNVVSEYTKTTTTYVGDQLFVYGEVVADFKHLQESAISTLSTSALQEVDRQLQTEKTKTAALETKYQKLLERIEAIEGS